MISSLPLFRIFFLLPLCSFLFLPITNNLISFTHFNLLALLVSSLPLFFLSFHYFLSSTITFALPFSLRITVLLPLHFLPALRHTNFTNSQAPHVTSVINFHPRTPLSRSPPLITTINSSKGQSPLKRKLEIINNVLESEENSGRSKRKDENMLGSLCQSLPPSLHACTSVSLTPSSSTQP